MSQYYLDHPASVDDDDMVKINHIGFACKRKVEGEKYPFDSKSQNTIKACLMSKISVPILPINLKKNGQQLWVQVTFFGNKHWAVLDTGASRTVFSKTVIPRHPCKDYKIIPILIQLFFQRPIR
jgi:hypothetical protein